MRFDEGRIESRAFHGLLHPLVFGVSHDVEFNMFLEPLALGLVVIDSNVRWARVLSGRMLAIHMFLEEVLVFNAHREFGEPRCKGAHGALRVRDESILVVNIPRLAKVDIREQTSLLNLPYVETLLHAIGERLTRIKGWKFSTRSNSAEVDCDPSGVFGRRACSRGLKRHVDLVLFEDVAKTRRAGRRGSDRQGRQPRNFSLADCNLTL